MALEPCFDDQGCVTGVSVRYFEAPHSSQRPGLSTSKPPLGMGVPMSSPLPPPLPNQGLLSSASPTPLLRSSSLPAPSATGLRDASPKSESRLSAARPPHEMLQSRLRKVLQNLEWLGERLSVPASIAPLDDTRERARTILAVEEARGLVSESVAMLEGEEQIPPAPRIPRM
jgi:hypothetical protein